MSALVIDVFEPLCTLGAQQGFIPSHATLKLLHTWCYQTLAVCLVIQTAFVTERMYASLVPLPMSFSVFELGLGCVGVGLSAADPCKTDILPRQQTVVSSITVSIARYLENNTNFSASNQGRH